jgi:hypothetical protein
VYVSVSAPWHAPTLASSRAERPASAFTSAYPCSAPECGGPLPRPRRRLLP